MHMCMIANICFYNAKYAMHMCMIANICFYNAKYACIKNDL